MKNLIALQQDFAQGLRSLGAISHLVKPHSSLSPELQFSIYKNAFISRFQKTLQHIFPVCCQLVGEEFFLAMTREFILETPSYSPDLNTYGENFPNFIAYFPPSAELIYLADVARLEWAWHVIYGAADEGKFNFEKLAAFSASGEERIFFSLPGRSTLLTSPYPVHHIWEVNQKDFDGAAEIILEPAAYFFLVWRKDYDLRIDVLTHAQWEVLSLIQKKLSLAEICETASEEINIPDMLPQLVSKGWIADCGLLGF
jgi:hypothetical protein